MVLPWKLFFQKIKLVIDKTREILMFLLMGNTIITGSKPEHDGVLKSWDKIHIATFIDYKMSGDLGRYIVKLKKCFSYLKKTY